MALPLIFPTSIYLLFFSWGKSLGMRRGFVPHLSHFWQTWRQFILLIFNLQWMSEIQTAKIQTMQKSEQKGIRNLDSSDLGHLGLWNTPQLSEIWTGHPHHNMYNIWMLFIKYLPPSGDGGSGLKRKALNVVLCFQLRIPFYFNVWNPNSQVPFWFLECGFQTEESVWNPNCLETGHSWTVKI